MLTVAPPDVVANLGLVDDALVGGLRPVFFPLYAINAPVDEIVEPFSKQRAAS